jgi:2-polyprenyl-3-methyl-5-hydroxy-6-metoxy-1,4-benzoquinol methylase
MGVRDRLHVLTSRFRRPEAALRSRDELHEYWRDPSEENVPQTYLDGSERSQYLVGLVRDHAESESRILEIGTNVGRNLHFLRQAGFVCLEGIEINETAMKEMRHAFPDLADVTIHNSAIEDVIPTLPASRYDVVFTMAVLEHIHPDSDWVFAEIVRVCGRKLITIEDEISAGSRHVRRNYRRVFTRLGMRQLYKEPIDRQVGLPVGFVARVFGRAD